MSPSAIIHSSAASEASSSGARPLSSSARELPEGGAPSLIRGDLRPARERQARVPGEPSDFGRVAIDGFPLEIGDTFAHELGPPSTAISARPEAKFARGMASNPSSTRPPAIHVILLVRDMDSLLVGGGVGPAADSGLV